MTECWSLDGNNATVKDSKKIDVTECKLHPMNGTPEGMARIEIGIIMVDYVSFANEGTFKVRKNELRPKMPENLI